MDSNVLKKCFFIILTGIIVCICIKAGNSKSLQQANTAPKVIITKPSSNDRFKWNSLITYSISVSDKEDGISEYNEIAANEVLLKIIFLPDSTELNSYLAKESANTPAPKELSLMKTSTCFNCHSVKNQLIGPSFEAIAKRYAQNPQSVNLLTNRVIKGSKSVWGTAEMPPHPELTNEQANKITLWILKNCSNPNLDYLPGLEGAFRTKPKPGKNAGKGVYILTASYTDHGLAGMPQQEKRGTHTIVLKSY
jgi:cytochrome c551/c552